MVAGFLNHEVIIVIVNNHDNSSVANMEGFFFFFFFFTKNYQILKQGLAVKTALSHTSPAVMTPFSHLSRPPSTEFKKCT